LCEFGIGQIDGLTCTHTPEVTASHAPAGSKHLDELLNFLLKTSTCDANPACAILTGSLPHRGSLSIADSRPCRINRVAIKPQGVFMRHYEIILIIHPDQSEQVPAMVERYKTLITSQGGQIHRFEDWGRRQMAYQIQKLAKAHYLCMNIECGQQTLDELEHAFKFNDAVLRHLTVKLDKAETAPSVMMKQVEKEEARKSQQDFATQ
jgi:small subunit ribosomal protein S6